jgi:hypothetical protein
MEFRGLIAIRLLRNNDYRRSMGVRPAVGGQSEWKCASVCLRDGKDQITLLRWEGLELGVPVPKEGSYV